MPNTAITPHRRIVHQHHHRPSTTRRRPRQDGPPAAGAGITNRDIARPLINVLIDYEDLTGRLAAKGIATLANGTPIDASTARRLACEANMIPTVLGTNSQPLDVGRAHRLATTAQRRAMLARSTTCEWHDCTTPASWCQAHHLTPWDENGPTNINNLAWLCNRHHHDAHEGGWHVTRDRHGHIHTKPPKQQRPDGLAPSPSIPSESSLTAHRSPWLAMSRHH